MRLKSACTVLISLIASAFAVAQKPELTPGSKAPVLSIKRWIKGAPVQELPEHGIAVVEFWATWCGTCRPWYPHLAELARKRQDITVMGIGIWEKDDPKIDAYVKDMGNDMDYHVGYSGEMDGMAATWMATSDSRGIPTAFIVKDRAIKWIGHPMNLEKTLDAIEAGTFDVKKAKKAYIDAHIQSAKELELVKASDEIDKQFWNGDREGARKKLADLRKANPKWTGYDVLELSWLTVGKEGEFTAAIDKLIKQNSYDAQVIANNAFGRCFGKPAAKPSLREAAIAIMAAGPEAGGLVISAYQFFKFDNDKPNLKVAAQKLLDLYKDMKLEPKMKEQLEADAKGG